MNKYISNDFDNDDTLTVSPPHQALEPLRCKGLPRVKESPILFKEKIQ